MSDPWDNDPVATPAAGTAANDSPWDTDPIAGQAPKGKASWWQTVSAIPGTTVGQMKEWVGGQLRSLAESDPATQALREKTGDYQADYWGVDQPHVQYIAKKEGRPAEDVSNDLRKAATTESLAAEYGAKIYKEGEKQVEENNPGDLTFWQKAVLNGGSSVLSQIPAIGLSVLSRNPAPAIGFAGVSQYGSTYGEARDKNLSPERAGMHAAIDATAEAAFEMIPMKFLVDKAGGPVGNLIMGTMLREVPTEVMTTAVQSANAKLSTRPEMGWKEYWQDILDTVGSTMVSAPLLAGAGAAAQRVGDRLQKPFTAPDRDPVWQSELLDYEIPGQGGTVNPGLTGPNIDEPTAIMDADTKAQALSIADSINPEDISDDVLAEARKVIEEHQKQQKTPALPGTEVAWSQVASAPTASADDIAELGASGKQAANAVNYTNPNTGERLDRPFLFGPEGYVGLTPRQVMPKPGTYTLGVPSDDRPADYLRALHDTVEQWRQEFLPNETIVLSNEELFSNSALGWHYHTPTGHLIVPAVLRKPSKGLGQYNPNTIASAFYNATHEFGHAIITSKFFEGMNQQLANQVKQESQTGVVTTTGLPAAQAAVVAEYNRLKGQVLDGSLNAEQFVEQWMGPAKVARKTFLKDLGVAPTAKAMDVVNALARSAAANSNIRDEISNRALQKRLANDFLSLEEYLAEQTARHAYQRKWDETSPLGQFFKSALESLRKFFVAQKRDGNIKPGTAFQEWLDGVGKSTRAPEVTTLVENKKRAGSKAGTRTAKKGQAGTETALAGVKEPTKAKAKVKKVAHNVQSSTKERTSRTAFKHIKFLEDANSITAEQANELRDLINREEWDEFTDKLTPLLAKNVKFELDTERATSKQDPEWKKDGFDSRFFKAWFGDWRNDPENASVVRVGVFAKGLDGQLVIDKNANTPPLIVFAPEERLQRGDSVIYSAGLRGIHNIEAHAPDPIKSTSMIPVVLNMRMPYIVQNPWIKQPSVEQVKAQGFDGIIFLNGWEGDVGYVTFDANQVKVVDSRNPFPKDTGVHLELDYDTSTPEGQGAAQLFRGVKNFLNSQGPLRRALRNAIGKGQYYALQMQQLAHIYQDLTDLAFFVATNVRYNTYKAARQAMPDKVLNFWDKTAKEEHRKIDKFLQDEAEGKKNWFELARTTKMRNNAPTPWYEFRMTQKALDEMKARGIDTDTDRGKELAQHLLHVKNSLLDSLNEDEAILFELFARRMMNNPAALRSQYILLRKQVQTLRETPFFPQGRFGNMVLTIEKRKDSGDGFEVVYREQFEKEEDWKRASERANTHYKDDPNTRVRAHLLTDTQYVLMSLPKEFAETMISELGLDDRQVDTLMQILQPIRSEKLLSKAERDKAGLKGFSTDAARSYANYTWHHANLQAKLLHRADFNLAITGLRSKLRDAEYAGAMSEIQRLTRVATMMEGTRDYIMSPPAEAQMARSLVSIAYLWFNVKTAAMNAWGLVTVIGDLTKQHGVAEGTKRFAQASWYMMKSMQLSDLNTRRKGDYLPPEIQEGLDRAIQEGVLSQSYAYHLATMANAPTLARLPLYQYAGKAGQTAIDVGMYPFRLVELGTRRVAFIAALQQELQDKTQSVRPTSAYERAVAKVNLLQNDYSLGNRPAMMRGGAFGLGPVMPLITIFATFAQHMAFHGYGGYELGKRRAISEAIKNGELPKDQEPKWYQWGYGYTARIWLLTLILAGYEGLPGMENLLDLLEFAWRKTGAKKGFRQELREMIQSVDGDPQLWSRGLGHNVAGFDISRSLGFGRIFPGTDTLAKSSQEKAQEMVGGVALDLMGPAGGVVKFGLGLRDKGFAEGMKQFPGGIGNIWSAYQWAQNGVRGPNGGLITIDSETGKPRDLTTLEVYGKALGFNPTIVSENREKFYTAHDRQMYWQAKRKDLLDKLNEAEWKHDVEGKADAKRAISEFNAGLPNESAYKGIKITPKDVAQSLATHRRNRRAEERGEPIQKRYRGLHEDIRGSFDQPE